MLLSFIIKTSYLYYIVTSKLIETLPTIVSCHTWIMTETELEDKEQCSENYQIIYKIP